MPITPLMPTSRQHDAISTYYKRWCVAVQWIIVWVEELDCAEYYQCVFIACRHTHTHAHTIAIARIYLATLSTLRALITPLPPGGSGGLKMWEWKMRYEQNCRGRQCRSGQYRSDNAWKAVKTENSKIHQTRVGVALQSVACLLSGVVQGSGIGPVMFIVFIDQLAKLLEKHHITACLLYTSPSPRDRQKSRMPSSA